MPAAAKKPPMAQRKSRRRPAPWEVSGGRAITLKPHASDEFVVGPKLDRIVRAVGLSTAADVLGVDRSQLNRCRAGRESMSPELTRRITDVEYVLDRALHILWPDEVGPWLTEPEPLLGGSIPLNVLALEGPARVINALDGIRAGAFA